MSDTDKHKDILNLAAERYKFAIDEDREDRNLYDKDVRFAVDLDGCQWDAKVKATREGDTPPRPCLAPNKIPEKIDMVEGEFRQLRPETKVRAVDSKADPKIADIFAGLLRHIKYLSDARSAYNTAHTSTLYGGRGAWRFDIVDDDDDPFVRNIEINRIPNVLTVAVDPEAKKLNKSDANYIFVTEILTEKEFKKEYPKKDLGDWPSDDLWEGWKTETGYRVAEYWWKEKVKKTFYRVERLIDGLPTVITVTDKAKGDKKAIEKEAEVIQVKWCKMIAGKILEGPHDWPTKDIPIFLESGKEINIRGRNYTRGMVRFAQVPQRMYNYWSSAITEMVALAPKSPYKLSVEMLGNHKAMWDSLHIKNWPYLLYDTDPNNPQATPQREPAPQMSTAYANELARHEHDIMSTMGIYREKVGEDKGDKSGKAILALQRQGDIGTYTFTDNFQTTLTYSDRALINLIPHVYDTERIVRILGEDGSEAAIPINARPGAPHIVGMLEKLDDKFKVQPKEGISKYLNDLRVGKYDVAVTIGPSYTTLRQEASAMFMEFVKILPPVMAANVADLIAETLDLPQSQKLLERLKKMIPPDIRGLEEGEQPPPQQQPDPKLLIEAQKLQIQSQEQQRKDWETQVNALKTMAEADAINRDQTLQELSLVVQHLKEQLMAQAPQEQPAQPAKPQGE